MNERLPIYPVRDRLFGGKRCFPADATSDHSLVKGLIMKPVPTVKLVKHETVPIAEKTPQEPL